MGSRSLIALITILVAFITAACTSSPPASSLDANVTSVRITRDPGLIVMPPLNRTITDIRTAQRLARDVLALPVMPSGTYNCPVDFGTSYRLSFAAKTPWSAKMDVLGCGTVSLSDKEIRWTIESPALHTDAAAALGISMSDLAPVPCETPSAIRCYPQPQSGKGLITGGIRPCQGIFDPNAPHYAAGTVTVLKGKMTLTSGRPPVFPSQVVASQQLKTNDSYLLALDPGDYVLQAHFPPPANVTPFVQVTVQSAQAVEVDIPNMCK